MKKVGIFSGSFNPIHIGHLALANWICEYEDLSEIWFLVTPQNPLKTQHQLLDYGLRLQMAKEAINGYPQFKVSDFEYSLPLPSYTIDTLKALCQAYPNLAFHLLVGADSWETIGRWKEASELLANFPILIYPRQGYDLSVPANQQTIRKVHAPIIEISSTFIREALKCGKDIRFFLPEAVRKYIPTIKKQIV